MADFRNIITVEPVLFLYMLCTIMTVPLLQQLAFQKICQQMYGAETCQHLTSNRENLVHSKTSKWILYQSVALTLPSIASSLILGSWSDKFGRKVVLLLPCVGSLLLYANYILNVVFFWANVDYLLIGTFVSGFFGGFATILLGVFSYISDVSDTMQRTVRVAVLESMIFLGGSVGNLIGGVLVQYYGYIAAFGLALGLNVLVVIYVIFVLQESYFPPERGEQNWAFVAVHKHLKSLFQVMMKRRPPHQRLNFAIIMLAIFPIFVLGFIGFNDVTVLYSKHSPRNFTSSLIGYLFAEVCFVKGVGIVLWVPLLSKLLHLSDLTIAIIGAVMSAGSYTFFGFAVNKWMMFLGGAFTLGNSMAMPCLRSRLSKQVEPTELGTMFALLASLEVLGTLLASVVFNTIYSYTVDWLPGFCYFLMSGLHLVALILLVFLTVVEKRSNPYSEIGQGVQVPEDTCSVT